MIHPKVQWKPYKFAVTHMEGILDQAVMGDNDLSTIRRASSGELTAWAGS